MKKIIAITGMLCSLLAAPTIAQSYDFNRYSVNEWHGHRVKPSFAGKQKIYDGFRTRLRDGVKNNELAAGHYVVIEIGCGALCENIYFGDVATGKILDFPAGSDGTTNAELKTSPTSKLIEAIWGCNMAGSPCKKRYYLIKPTGFTLIGKE